jgi:hypothetical protein
VNTSSLTTQVGNLVLLELETDLLCNPVSSFSIGYKPAGSYRSEEVLWNTAGVKFLISYTYIYDDK